MRKKKASSKKRVWRKKPDPDWVELHARIDAIDTQLKENRQLLYQLVRALCREGKLNLALEQLKDMKGN